MILFYPTPVCNGLDLEYSTHFNCRYQQLVTVKTLVLHLRMNLNPGNNTGKRRYKSNFQHFWRARYLNPWKHHLLLSTVPLAFVVRLFTAIKLNADSWEQSYAADVNDCAVYRACVLSVPAW
jgi:hypothetical protein